MPTVPDVAVYLDAKRGPTSRRSLQIDWDYPVLAADAPGASGRTRAKAARHALPLDRAFLAIAGEDERPLLVLRECIVCNGTDDALLSNEVDNERTLLLTRYFHCVKLPPEVLDESHPFTHMFPGEEPPHLFVAQRDGRAVLPLTGTQSRTELWEVMERTLAEAYEDDPGARLRDLTRCLDRLDVLDDKLARLAVRIERELEQSGPGSRKLKSIARDEQELKAERAELEARLVELAKARLKPVASAPGAAGSDDAAGEGSAG